jgi:hypothetical protein
LRWDDDFLINGDTRLEGVGLSCDDGTSVFNDGLLDDVNGLHDNLFMLDLDGDLIGDLDWNLNDLGDFTGNWVWSWNVHNLLDDLLLVLNDSVGSLDGHWNWNWLLNDALDRVRDVSLDNLLDWNRNFDGVGLTNLIGSWDWSLNDLHYLTNYGVGYGPIDNSFDSVWHLIWCWDLDLVGDVDVLLYDLDDWVWDWDVHNFVNGVGNGPFNDFGNLVGNLDMVTNSYFDWNLNGTWNLSCHSVGDGDWGWDRDRGGYFNGGLSNNSCSGNCCS